MARGDLGELIGFMVVPMQGLYHAYSRSFWYLLMQAGFTVQASVFSALVAD